MGAKPAADQPALPDIQRYEFAAWSPLAVLTVVAGLWPAVLLGLTDPAVQKLLAGGKS
jgi:NADH-quinone oxidoreductase subunit M